MPRYHFHLYEGREILVDVEGTDLAGLQAAYEEAMQFAGELMIHEAQRLIANGGCRLVVEDAEGAPQFRLDVGIALEPAQASAGPFP